eukprot:7294213-Prorocentrum_lima.AAC.1
MLWYSARIPRSVRRVPGRVSRLFSPTEVSSAPHPTAPLDLDVDAQDRLEDLLLRAVQQGDDYSAPGPSG